MSLKLNERYPGRFDNPSAGYPQGSFKNRTAPGALDGSYLEKDWANDKEGFFQSLLSAAGFVANGVVDSVGASQYYDALAAVIGTLAPAAPDASTTVKGIVELATSAETQTGTDSVRAVTPSGLASIATTSALDATTGRLARIGDFGLGGIGPDAANADTIAASGVYTVSAGTGGTLPSPGLLGTLLHLERNSSLGRAQILADSSGVLWSRTTVFGTGSWRAWATITPGQATTSTQGIVELATAAETTAGTDTVRAVVPNGLQTKMSGVISGQYPITPGAQAVFNHNLGVIPFMVEFSFVCLTAEGGWSAGDVVHRGNWYQNSVSTDGSPGIFWYGETTTQVTFGNGSTQILLPTKTTGFRFAATAANWRFVARVIG
ncbi:hypothetical protein QZH45_09765 [Pseudomonas corrugata]|uniref:hypothetical protein n=1 Tax=Pseudomonas corrugata TaxID=47879 RepID=UPI003D813659